MSLRRDKAVSRAVGRAIHQYGMISDGDRIAVALSGGKDSLTLMWALHERLSRIPINYSLLAIPPTLLKTTAKKWVTGFTSSIPTMEEKPTVMKTVKTRAFCARGFEENGSLN